MVDLVARLLAFRYSFSNEYDLQEGLAQVLTADGTPFLKEHVLGGPDRIDFLVGKIGIEVKVGGGLTPVTRQVHRYLQYEALDGLILVTTRSAHRVLPETMNGKPIIVAYLPPM